MNNKHPLNFLLSNQTNNLLEKSHQSVEVNLNSFG